MATKLRSIGFLAALMFLIGCAAPALTPLPPPPPGVEVLAPLEKQLTLTLRSFRATAIAGDRLHSASPCTKELSGQQRSAP